MIIRSLLTTLFSLCFQRSPQEWAEVQNNLDLALKALKEASVQIQQ